MSWDSRMSKNWGLGEAGRGLLERGRLLRGCLSFQIQAFDPELWVWGRDRALLSQAPGPQVGLRGGGTVASGAGRMICCRFRKSEKSLSGPTL